MDDATLHLNKFKIPMTDLIHSVMLLIDLTSNWHFILEMQLNPIEFDQMGIEK